VAIDVDICVCTHDPRRDVLAIALGSIARQGANTIVIDNASNPPLAERDLAPLAGVPHRLVREPIRGVAFARGRSIRESTAPWILFVDDDNELAPDYLAAALAIARAAAR
jgi:glycosyltransferase involved in cell wall biosynthesis